jgi:TRAP-type C4-dicarboxylate transport system permease small subunit
MQQVLVLIRSIADWSDRVAEKVLIFLISAMFIAVLVQIFHRYIIIHFIKFSFPYTEEFARYSTIWITYLGIAVGLKEGIHVSLDLIYTKLSSKVQRLFYIVQRIIMLYFTLVIFIAGWNFLGRISSNVSTTMRIPMIWAYSAPWIGSWLILLRLLVQLLGAIIGFEEQKTNFKDVRND